MTTKVEVDKKSPFHSIIDNIINWDLNSKTGAGIYFNNEKYGHIEFKVSTNNHGKNSINWNSVEGIIPDDYNSHISTVDSVLNEFSEFFRDIRAQEIYLNFEITNISYHPVDYRDIGYKYATTFAILNCFGHPDFNFNSNKIWKL
jgi:hypothetical protein